LIFFYFFFWEEAVHAVLNYEWLGPDIIDLVICA
jgi:hypothetical protein